MDALGNLYEPNAVFSQFLGPASMTFFSLFLSLLPLLVLSFLAFFVFLFFPFLFRSLFFAFLSTFLFFYFLCFLFSSWLESDVHMRSDRYYVRGSLCWVTSGIVGFSRRE